MSNVFGTNFILEIMYKSDDFDVGYSFNLECLF